ncbi:hypothetical protein PG994_009031 [Apiospora phragmitis]|uniref:2EXR domain-containing protein n=1 Tax=Apiospora phragmitis TaxID=2905665 RepID=A0ABR1UI56_9PEZI
MANNFVARPGANSNPSTFHRFPILPPELRLTIWEQAFLEIAKECPRDWELLLRDAQDGGAVVVNSDRRDTPVAAGPSRDLYVMDLRMASREANYCFTTYA